MKRWEESMKDGNREKERETMREKRREGERARQRREIRFHPAVPSLPCLLVPQSKMRKAIARAVQSFRALSCL